MDLRRQFAFARTRVPIIGLFALSAAVPAYIVADGRPTTYQATATMMVGRPLSGAVLRSDELLVAQQLPTSYATVINSRPFLARVGDRLTVPSTAEEVASSVDVVLESDSAVFNIVARSSNGNQAAELANVVADELMTQPHGSSALDPIVQRAIAVGINATLEQIATLETEVERLTAMTIRSVSEEAALAEGQATLTELVAAYRALSDSLPAATYELTMIQPAIAAALPGRSMYYAGLALVLTALLATSFFLVLEYLDDRMKSPQDVEEVTGVPTLGVIPTISGMPQSQTPIVMLRDPHSRAAECYRTLRTNVDLACSEARSMLIASPGEREGRTATAANLAVAWALAGRKVLLVDADLRQPRLHSAFGIPEAPGLTNVLRLKDPGFLSSVTYRQSEHLHVLSAGAITPDARDLLQPLLIRTFIDHALVNHDLVIFDSPPLGGVIDSAVLSACVDATILVVDARRTRRPALIEACDRLEQGHATVVGTVLNGGPYGATVPFPRAVRGLNKDSDARTSNAFESSGPV